jgi:hypothetical protein
VAFHAAIITMSASIASASALSIVDWIVGQAGLRLSRFESRMSFSRIEPQALVFSMGQCVRHDVILGDDLASVLDGANPNGNICPALRVIGYI